MQRQRCPHLQSSQPVSRRWRKGGCRDLVSLQSLDAADKLKPVSLPPARTQHVGAFLASLISAPMLRTAHLDQQVTENSCTALGLTLSWLPSRMQHSPGSTPQQALPSAAVNAIRSAAVWMPSSGSAASTPAAKRVAAAAWSESLGSAGAASGPSGSAL